ncbi:hypothetical protein FA15DRAFT_657479 [Coprinopsis marcescibilis]|uniref:Uncharacterized protein n=1 Tax=Coprinopsis marcescibilis TaxID=230819 RepID=A0A5C3KQJ3_COPMA|nr:hypothetical protein FA15DRAFT_657479 [Coprinopsis marcescibilis]
MSHRARAEKGSGSSSSSIASYGPGRRQDIKFPNCRDPRNQNVSNIIMDEPRGEVDNKSKFSAVFSVACKIGNCILSNLDLHAFFKYTGPNDPMGTPESGTLHSDVDRGNCILQLGGSKRAYIMINGVADLRTCKVAALAKSSPVTTRKMFSRSTGECGSADIHRIDQEHWRSTAALAYKRIDNLSNFKLLSISQFLNETLQYELFEGKFGSSDGD